MHLVLSTVSFTSHTKWVTDLATFISLTRGFCGFNTCKISRSLCANHAAKIECTVCLSPLTARSFHKRKCSIVRRVEGHSATSQNKIGKFI